MLKKIQKKERKRTCVEVIMERVEISPSIFKHLVVHYSFIHLFIHSFMFEIISTPSVGLDLRNHEIMT